eukprot:3484807-Pyramimonas_sp.AAC.1
MVEQNPYFAVFPRQSIGSYKRRPSGILPTAASTKDYCSADSWTKQIVEVHPAGGVKRHKREFDEFYDDDFTDIRTMTTATPVDRLAR